MRMTIYNQYVKNHFFIIDISYAPTRLALLRKFRSKKAIMPAKMLQRHFYLTFLDNRYRFIKLFFHVPLYQPMGKPAHMYLLLRKDPDYLLLKGFKEATLAPIIKGTGVQKFFVDFIDRELPVMANYLICYNCDQFGEYIRYDYPNLKSVFFPFVLSK